MVDGGHQTSLHDRDPLEPSLEWHTEAEHPGWTATNELLRPYPNQRRRVVYRRSAPPAS